MFEFVSKKTWLDFNASTDDIKLTTTYENYPGDNKNTFIPIRSTPGSAGYDFRSPFNFAIDPGEKVIFPTGLKWNPKTCEAYPIYGVLQLYPRSSLGFKYGFTLLNTVGIIDADYYNNSDNEGHIMIGFTVNKRMKINVGDKICQGLILPIILDDEIVPTVKRQGGIGSTGK